MADYRFCVGSVARTLVTGNQTVSGIADISGAFTPKAVLFWGTAQSGGGTALDARYFFGWTMGPTGDIGRQQCTSTYKANDQLASAPFFTPYFSKAFQTPDSCIALKDDTPTTVTDAAYLISFASGSFTIQWSANNGAPWDVHYLAMGGTDLNVETGFFLTPTSIGAQVVPAATLGQITTVLFAPVYSKGPVSSGVSIVVADLMPALGWASATGLAQGSTASRSQVISPKRTYFMQRADRAIQLIDQTTPSDPACLATVSSLGVGAFTVDWSLVTGAPGLYGNMGVFFLAISGPAAQAGSLVSPGLDSTVPVAVPFIPGAILFQGAGQPTTPGQSGPLGYSLGALDTLDHKAQVWLGDADNANPTQAARTASQARVISAAAPTGLGVTEQLSATAALTSTGFDVAWDMTDVTPREFLYLALEGAIAPPPPPPPPPTPVICQPNWPIGVI